MQPSTSDINATNGIELEKIHAYGLEALKNLENLHSAKSFQASVKAMEVSVSRAFLEAPAILKTSLNRTMQEARKTIESLWATDFQKILKNALKDANLQHDFEKLQQQAKDMLRDIDSDQFKRFAEEAQDTVNRARFPAKNEITINGGFVLSGSVSVTTENVNTLSNSVSSEMTLEMQEQFKDITQTFENFLVKVDAVTDFRTRSLLYSIIFPLFLVILTIGVSPFVNYHVMDYLQGKNEKREASKQINTTATTLTKNKLILNSFRYVYADTLHVRKTPNSSGEILGDLHFGQPVEIIRKKRKWTLVRQMDETGETCIKGWVFTRYLKKFK